MPAKRVAVKKTARKSAAKTATAKKTAAKTTSTRPRVRIRTYRHGLGDCHLLSFRKPDGKQFHSPGLKVFEVVPARAVVAQKYDQKG